MEVDAQRPVGPTEMKVDEAPRNTPFLSGPQKIQASEALLGWLCNRYQTKDLVNVDPMSCFEGASAPERARVSVRPIPLTFEGSAAEFQYAADNGFPARISLADALGGMGPRTTKTMLPHGRPGLDKKQGISPDLHDLDAVFINSVSLADPLNTLPMPVGIVSSMVPPVYAEMKKKQAEELATELKQEAVHPDMVAHIPVSLDGKPDLRQIPVLKEVVNTFHASEICRTFGGITSEDLWRGLHFFTPAEAISLGMLRPPVGMLCCYFMLNFVLTLRPPQSMTSRLLPPVSCSPTTPGSLYPWATSSPTCPTCRPATSGNAATQSTASSFPRRASCCPSS